MAKLGKVLSSRSHSHTRPCDPSGLLACPPSPLSPEKLPPARIADARWNPVIFGTPVFQNGGRNRYFCLMLVLLTISWGIGSRRNRPSLPPFVAEYAGDFLWAACVCFFVFFVFNKIKTRKGAAVALAFSFLVEFSQLYQAAWINEIRRTTLGALTLGNGFLWTDLVCYAFGVLFAVGVDSLFFRWGGGTRRRTDGVVRPVRRA